LSDDDRCLDRQSLTPSDSGNLNSSVVALSECPAVGIAICDDQLRYVCVNHALAAMNGIPAELHIGKTVREVLGSAASSVELVLRCVLHNGQGVSNVEIRGNLPTRNTEGYWVGHYFPVGYANGIVAQVGAAVVEITGLRRLENSIRALLREAPPPPRNGYQFQRFGMPHLLEKGSVALGSGSIESVENLVRAGLKNSHRLQSTLQPTKMSDLTMHQRVSRPCVPSAIPGKPYRHDHGSIPTGGIGAKPLSPRETEIVRLLAQGKGNKEISQALTISKKTVETYRAKIMLKLQIHSLSDLVLYAVRCGFVKP
jgi:DNA-binding CsgD family transcriptional regulator